MAVPSVENREYDRRKSDTAVQVERRGSKNRRREKAIFEYAFEALPQFRRLESVSNEVNGGQAATALGLAGLVLMNLPEDCRDVIDATKQVKCMITGEKYDGAYKHREYQHNFSFLKGTIIETWVYKHADAGKKWANWLINNDKTLAETKFGEKVLNAVGCEEKDIIETQITNIKGLKTEATMYGGTKFAELTGRALKRTTFLGVLVMGVLELPKILSSTTKGDDISEKTASAIKQSAKSALNVASITASMGYCGAIGSKCCKGFGSLIGMGVGAILGNEISKKAQDFIS